MSPAVAERVALDTRVKAYCSPGPEVFSAVVHGNQIWTPDPFDVESIYADAREQFARLVARSSSADPPPHGKSLLLLGESGSGKTHLMRAFRATAHENGAAYCAYLQLNSRSDNYAGYVLSNVVSSLEQPYHAGLPETGLSRLAQGLLDALDVISDAERKKLCDDTIDLDDATRLVYRFADFAVQYPKFRDIDIDLLRALLFTLPNDGRVRARILKWLRCEDLNKFDRELIGDLVPRPGPEMPLKTLVGLGRLIHAVHSAGFVLLVDQIEEVIDIDRKCDDRGEALRNVVNTVIDITDGVPNAVVVMGCLEDLFQKGRQYLPRPKLDRLERDPEPIRLGSKRTPDEIAAMLAPRLEAIFDPDPSDPIAPFTAKDMAGLVGFRPRDILDNFRRHREACAAAGAWVPPAWTVDPPPPPSTHWEVMWNDFRSAYATPLLSDEPSYARLLADTVAFASAEMPHGIHFGADPEERYVAVETHTGNAVEKLYVAVCDKSTRGGGLTNEMRDVMAKVGEIPTVVVRSTEFPTDPKQGSVQRLAQLVAPRGKGRRVVVSTSEWRDMAAFRKFHEAHAREPGFADWQRAEHPLSEIRAVSVILGLDKLLAAPPAPPPPPTPPLPPAGVPKEVAKAVPPWVASPPTASAIRLGTTRGSLPAAVELNPLSLCRHAAFLGGSGSGKTTAALCVIEQLLLSGVPAVLIDRKGDLVRYADPEAWFAPEPNADRAARRARLRDAIDVAVYTPGNDAGRPLAVPVAPPDLAQATTADRELLAQFAAASVGNMMSYKSKGPDPRLVILQKAIEVLAATGRGVTVKGLQELVADADDALTSQFNGQYEAKYFRNLGRDLLTLSVQSRRLLEGGASLDVDELLGRAAHAAPGRTRLTIINTQFLGDPVSTDFWVSQLLLAVDRWRAKNPCADRLQAVFLFDEADLYLPAGAAKPATKGPMESLLRRARSAGLGVFLATQSPGDLDYKCRDQVLTWLIGRVKEHVAVGKLRPMLEVKPDAVDKLAGQKAGEFYLVRESDVSAVAVDRNLIPTAQVPVDRILELARAADMARRR